MGREEVTDDNKTKKRKRDKALFRWYSTTIFTVLGLTGGVVLTSHLLVSFGKCHVEDGDVSTECKYKPFDGFDALIVMQIVSLCVFGECANITS